MASGLAASLYGQAATGNVYGRVTDEQGGVLPGVTVTLSGVGAPWTTTTDSRGGFRFLNLAPGTYSVETELSGFATVERSDVAVNLGANTELEISMKVESVAETVTVSSEPPLLDARKDTSGSQFDQEELKQIPTARDPWVILQQVPGVLVDRINVGGSQSGQQSLVVGKGTTFSQNAWNVDGVTITDMRATGLSPTYYDFDAFQQMQATTGGSDPSIAVAGVTLNMVTKRGTNEVHGSARIFGTDRRFQAKPGNPEAARQGLTKLNQINGIQDYGLEAGGPVVPDKAWLWGSYGRNQINLIQASGTADDATLENMTGKLNLQPIESNSLTLFYLRGDKVVLGRGSGPTHPQPTSWDQSTTTTIWKGDDSQVLGASFFADVAWSYVDSPGELAPEGGLNPTVNGQPVDVILDPNGIWQNSFVDSRGSEPQHQVVATASYFFNTGLIGHELKFGFGYRNVVAKSSFAWPGSGNVGLEAFGLAELTRQHNVSEAARYFDGYLSDTLTWSRLTVNAGVRYDEQYGQNLPSSAPANPVFPDLLPAIRFPGTPVPFRWKSWEPRVAAAYAVGAGKKTLLRASYARYADQLGTGNVAFNNPVGGSYLYYYWSDTNGNQRVDPGELGDFYYAYGVDPNNPTALSSPNLIDPKLKAPTTDEVMVGVDHELLPAFVAGLTYTHRYRKNKIWYELLGCDGNNADPCTSADYVQINGGVPGYDTYGNLIGTTGPLYDVAGGYGGNFGYLETNRPDYHQTYDGVELQLTKRLSNRWMAHASFTYADWRQHVGSIARGCIDPTNQIDGNGNSCDNGVVYLGSGGGTGPFANVYINSTWSFNVNGLYQLPMNFNIAANFYGRQGYLIPFYVVEPTSAGGRFVAVGAADAYRNNTVTELDLRVAKVIPLFQKADLTLSVDLFNALNNNTILQRQTRLGTKPGSPAAQGNRITEVQSPRILRFGGRISF
jgi:hypothetical protein